MALLFLDSFDHFDDTDTTEKWTTFGGTLGSTGQVVSGGRHSSNAFQNTTTDSDLSIGVTNTSAWGCVGCALKANGNSLGTDFISIKDADANVQLFLRYRANGGFDVWEGPNTVLGNRVLETGANLWHANQWHYIEFRYKIDSSAGEAYVYFNGLLVGSVTGVDTEGAAGDWSIVGISQAGLIDDVYVMNGGGDRDAEAGPLGDTVVEALIAQTDAADPGALSDWTPSTGSDNGAMVDETPPDDNTTYNESETAGEKDTYNFPSLSVITGDIFGIQALMSVAKAADTGGRNIRVITRPTSTNYFSAIQAVAGTSFIFYRKNEDVNPDDSADYEIADVNGMEAGIELNS